MAFQPALLECLALSALRVSNLTNLIAVAQSHVTVAELTGHLAVPMVACAAGYLGWRLALRHRDLTPVDGPPTCTHLEV
jgi:hypothetical protein